MSDFFTNDSYADRLQGCRKTEEGYECLFCDFQTLSGYIYTRDEQMVDAHKHMLLHIDEDHGGVLHYLTGLDKKAIGLSEQQSKIIRAIYEGLSDQEIQQQMKIGSISTVRNHRASLREKEKQVKAMAAIFELLSKVTDDKKVFVKPHGTATMIDDRYNITEEERQKVIEKYFPDGTEGRLTTFYVKEKHKIIILGQIIRHFEGVRRYREKEVDEILKAVYPDDYVLIRRYLIQYGFLDRERDGSYYWIKEASDSKVSTGKQRKDKENVKKKALKKAFKTQVAQQAKESGVYQIRNMLDGKVYLGTARDIHKLEGLKFQLNTRSFPNGKLQEDWTSLGENNFAIEVLESFEEGPDSKETMERLSAMKKTWKEKLQPYGDKGYHRINTK